MSNSNINIKKLKRQILTHVKLIRYTILGVILILVLVIGFFIYQAIAKSVVGTYVGAAKNFIVPSSDRIKTDNGRINVLLLGIGGAGHDAPDLTDTIILASISTTSPNMSLISLPRDIWINTLHDKINSAYMYGGMVLAKSTVEEVTGVQIDYSVVIDFGGFKDVIDAVDGISVDVKNGFTDTQYPIAGRENDNCSGDVTFACRYETISFNSGVQTMNGETALKFVRSRHASGIEGNDISREARQQLVVNSIVKKVLTPKVFTNFQVDQRLLKVAQNDIKTDLKLGEEATLSRYLINAKANMKSYTIPDDLLYNPVNQYKYFNSLFTHAFVFVPNNKQSINGNIEDWSDVQKWVGTVLP